MEKMLLYTVTQKQVLVLIQTAVLYGAGRFGYSINQFSASIADANLTVSTGSWSDLDYSAELSASAAAGEFTKVAVALTCND